MQKFKDFIIDNFGWRKGEFWESERPERLLVQMGVIALVLLPALFGTIFFWKTKTKYLYKDAEKKYVMKYAYTFKNGHLRHSLFGTSVEQGEDLCKYYRKVNKYYAMVKEGNINRIWYISPETNDTLYTTPDSISLHFGTGWLPLGRPLYMPREFKNDSVVKVYDINTCCWGYYEAFVPNFCLHDNPPPDSLLNKFQGDIGNIPDPRDYGFYCD
ncbi:MAG: hypothetical protein CRN43_02155 [Candidatus Nephrothrix sp. EaCA]|nr:MAG: hypothetical protein CRN43_02155 [Candidatus Nephrothrix sp. EaCA]